MLRPPKTYLVPIPIEPLNSDSFRFWLQIMQEHALFIKGGLPANRVEDLQEAQAFYEEFTALKNKAAKNMNEKKFAGLVADAESLVKEFYSFKRYLLNNALACKLGGSLTPLLLDHVSREAAYFLRLLDKLTDKVNGFRPRQNLFWIQIQQEHTLFIRQMLDPSERTLIQSTQGFVNEFNDLVLTGYEYVSMLHQQGPVSAYRRFLKDVKDSVTELRDFEQAAYMLAKECQLLGIMPALLADHVKREAEHYLMILSLTEKGNIPCVMEDGEEDIVITRPPMEKNQDDFIEAEQEDGISKQETQEFDEIEEPELKQEQVEEMNTKPQSKWGADWPRPLGK